MIFCSHKFLACSSPVSDLESAWLLLFRLIQRCRLAKQPWSKGSKAEENRLMSVYRLKQISSKNWIWTCSRATFRSKSGGGSVLNSSRSRSPWCQNSSAAKWLTCWCTSQGLVLCPKSAAVIIAAWTSSRFPDCWRNAAVRVWSSILTWRARFDMAEAWRKWRARSVARMQCSMTSKVSAYSSCLWDKQQCQHF